MAAITPRRSWLQFSIQTFFWIVLVVSVGLVAYRRGYDVGFANLANQRSIVGNTITVAYAVGDVVPMRTVNGVQEPDFGGLIEDLTEEVLPNTWIESGGGASVAEFTPNKSVVIRHDQDGHERVAKFFEQLRRRNGSSLPTSN